MGISDLLTFLTLGAFLGALGQGARVIVGIKKMNDEAAATGLQSKDLFAANQLLLSLLIGAVAGGIATFFYITDSQADITAKLKELWFTLFAAGYAGADFIEGFMATKVSALSAPTAAASSQVGTLMESGGSGANATPQVQQLMESK
ncbi:MAG: hypothetical protein HZA22_08740 [Nitrospirae bacterium]|nr:hypothetical protein [Nitrospirota bacterium]